MLSILCLLELARSSLDCKKDNRMKISNQITQARLDVGIITRETTTP